MDWPRRATRVLLPLGSGPGLYTMLPLRSCLASLVLPLALLPALSRFSLSPFHLSLSPSSSLSLSLPGSLARFSIPLFSFVLTRFRLSLPLSPSALSFSVSFLPGSRSPFSTSLPRASVTSPAVSSSRYAGQRLLCFSLKVTCLPRSPTLSNAGSDVRLYPRGEDGRAEIAADQIARRR